MLVKDESESGKQIPILITGSRGFIGSTLVELLLKNGFSNLRCFMRPSGNIERFMSLIETYPHANLDLFTGNLLSLEDCKKAVKGVEIVYHLAAGTGKSFPGCFLDSAVTTRNLLEALTGSPALKRFVSVSSFSVYTNYRMKRGALLDENCQIENEHARRSDAYAYGKVKQDEIVIRYGKEKGIPYTILRPGVVFGPGRGGSILGRSGVDTFGFFMHITGRYKIPLTYVENCAKAIMMAGFADGIEGEVFNIVDDNLPSSRALVKAVKRNLGKFFSLRVPYHIFYIFNILWEKYSTWSQGQLPPVFNPRMCSIYHKGNRYTNEKLKRMVGWKPDVPMNEALKRYFEYMKCLSKE